MTQDEEIRILRWTNSALLVRMERIVEEIGDVRERLQTIHLISVVKRAHRLFDKPESAKPRFVVSNENPQ